MFQVLLGSGLRVKELIRLKVKDITFLGTLKGKIETKTVLKGKPHATTMRDDLIDKVYAYTLSKKLGPNDYVFTTGRNNKPYETGSSLNQTLKTYAKKVGINKKITNHYFTKGYDDEGHSYQRI